MKLFRALDGISTIEHVRRRHGCSFVCRYTTACDVFSFGGLLYEITHATFPFAKEAPEFTVEVVFSMTVQVSVAVHSGGLSSRGSASPIYRDVKKFWPCPDGNNGGQPTNT